MTHNRESDPASKRVGGSSAHQDEREREAQAALDQVRVQAGGALSGRELLRRIGERAENETGAPPLDWRMTPRNVVLQLLAIALFLVVMGFMISLLYTGFAAFFQAASSGS